MEIQRLVQQTTQAEGVSRQEPHDDVDGAPCTTRPHEEPEPRLEPQDEVRAASGRRASFKTSSLPSCSTEQALPAKISGRPRSSERMSRVTSQAWGFAAVTCHSCPLPSKPSGRPRSAVSVEPVASALGLSTSDKPGRRAFHATQLRSSPSDLPPSGPDEKVIETVSPPRIPLLPDLSRTCRMTASDAATRELFPAPRPHDTIFSVPESHDDTLDFSIEPTSPAAAAENEDSACQFRTAARFTTALRGIDAAAREIYPAPSPQGGTLDFSIESASLPAVATFTDKDPGHSSTASSFNTAVRGSDTTARENFPTPRPQDGTLDFGIDPLVPAAVATHADSARSSSAVAS